MKISKGILGLALSVVVVFAVSLGFVGPAHAQKGPIVFALIEPLSGPFKDVGTEVAAFVEYAVEQINAKGGIIGQQVKLIELDNQMKPDIAVRMARKAVLEEGAKVIMNHTSSAVGLALSKLAPDLNVVYVDLHAEADEITGSEFQPNTFRVSFSTSMHSGMLANYFAKSPYKRFYLLNQDYAFGHAVSDAFKKTFLKVKRADQEIVGEDFHPMANKDFGPYITKALAAKPEVLITGNFGPDLPGLVKQGRDLGLKAVIGSYYLDAAVYMNQIRNAGVGAITAEIYLASVNTKKNQDFIKSWQAWYKKHYPDRPKFYLVPSSVGGVCIDGLAFLAEAIKKAGSTDAAKIVKAWEGLSYEGVMGKLTMRPCDHQIQAGGYVATIQADHAFKSVLDFPFLSKPVAIPLEQSSVPGNETGNPRCN
jgi:branched-chain amino acid transport system substrate-binding protein